MSEVRIPEGDIIAKITQLASSLTEQDLEDWAIPDLMQFYDEKIFNLSNRAYSLDKSESHSLVGVGAFKERARMELKTALATFLFKSQHWKTGRDINSYLLTSLNRLADRLRCDTSVVKKANILVCPACRLDNRKEFLTKEDKLWRCQACSQIIDNLNFNPSSSKVRLCKAFALHSRKGYRCLDCKRFIPESINTSYGISCPYEDCIFMGKIPDLEIMPHPVALSQRTMISLQTNIGDGTGRSANLQDFLEADFVQPDIQLGIQEQNKKEYDLLLQVINDQIFLIKRMNAPGTMIQKLLMYEAYKAMLWKHPEEMVSYLVHRKQNADFPIQARVFQEYASLIEAYLPFSIEKKHTKIDILSLTDPNLSLFLGKSIYEAEVKNNNTIPNNTLETYTGGRKFKDYGPCFIGKVIDIIDRDTKQSLLSHMKEYSFVQIKMDKSVNPGTLVTVSHFRLPSHYEMKSLVFLQRIRRQIVDKIYFRLNKKKRKPGE